MGYPYSLSWASENVPPVECDVGKGGEHQYCFLELNIASSY